MSIDGKKFVGIKTVSIFQGHRSHVGTIQLFDGDDGRLLYFIKTLFFVSLFLSQKFKIRSIIEASSVTSISFFCYSLIFRPNLFQKGIRTAASSAFSTSKILGEEKCNKAQVLSFLGCGELAHTHLVSMLKVLPNIKTLKLWNRTNQKVVQFIEEKKILYPNINFVGCETPNEAASESDVICTLTGSKIPLISKKDIREG